MVVAAAAPGSCYLGAPDYPYPKYAYSSFGAALLVSGTSKSCEADFLQSDRLVFVLCCIQYQRDLSEQASDKNKPMLCLLLVSEHFRLGPKREREGDLLVS